MPCPGRSLCRGYDKARPVLSISYGFCSHPAPDPARLLRQMLEDPA